MKLTIALFSIIFGLCLAQETPVNWILKDSTLRTRCTLNVETSMFECFGPSGQNVKCVVGHNMTLLAPMKFEHFAIGYTPVEGSQIPAGLVYHLYPRQVEKNVWFGYNMTIPSVGDVSIDLYYDLPTGFGIEITDDVCLEQLFKFFQASTDREEIIIEGGVSEVLKVFVIGEISIVHGLVPREDDEEPEGQAWGYNGGYRGPWGGNRGGWGGYRGGWAPVRGGWYNGRDAEDVDSEAWGNGGSWANNRGSWGGNRGYNGGNRGGWYRGRDAEDVDSENWNGNRGGWAPSRGGWAPVRGGWHNARATVEEDKPESQAWGNGYNGGNRGYNGGNRGYNGGYRYLGRETVKDEMESENRWNGYAYGPSRGWWRGPREVFAQVGYKYYRESMSTGDLATRTRCQLRNESTVIECVGPVETVMCDIDTNFTGLKSNVFELYGIGLPIAVAGEVLPQGFHLYPRSLDNKQWHNYVMPIEGKDESLCLYQKEDISTYGIRVETPECYQKLVESFKLATKPEEIFVEKTPVQLVGEVLV